MFIYTVFFTFPAYNRTENSISSDIVGKYKTSNHKISKRLANGDCEIILHLQTFTYKIDGNEKFNS